MAFVDLEKEFNNVQNIKGDRNEIQRTTYRHKDRRRSGRS